MTAFDDPKYKSYLTRIRQGYNTAAQAYLEQKDTHQIHLLPYKEFKTSLPENAHVIELGCASGFPVGGDLLNEGFEYIGIDLSSKQIELAQQRFPSNTTSFVEQDLLEYLQHQDDVSIDGIISFFTIFHLPRSHHVVLFDQILRVLKPGGQVLFTAHGSSWQGNQTDWFGTTMYWSNFSYKFYRVMLPELGFEEKLCYADTKKFNDKPETSYYLIYIKPVE